MAVAAGEIKKSLVVAICSKRWCPHDVMMAGPLTKRLHTADLQPLLQVMKSGQYTFGSELDEEEFRQQERDAGRILRTLKGVLLSDEPMLVGNSSWRGSSQAFFHTVL